MQFKFDQDIEKVFHILVDPEIYIERCEALGETNVQCDTQTSGGKTTMKVARTVRRDLPGPLAKIAKADNTIKSNVVWNNDGEGKRKAGYYDATIDGSPIPITIRADFSLEPTSDGGTNYNIQVTVKAKHMLLGKIAEKFAGQEVEKTLPVEHAWNKQKLASMA